MRMAWPPVTRSLQAGIRTHQASRHHLRSTCRVCASRKVPKGPNLALERGEIFLSQFVISSKQMRRISERARLIMQDRNGRRGIDHHRGSPRSS